VAIARSSVATGGTVGNIALVGSREVIEHDAVELEYGPAVERGVARRQLRGGFELKVSYKSVERSYLL